MSDQHVPKGSRVRIGAVDGDLNVEKNVRIEADGRVAVTGRVRFDGPAEVAGDLECASLRADHAVVRILGALSVHDDLDGERSSIRVDGAFHGQNVDVDKELVVMGPAVGERFEVGGTLECGNSLTARRVAVGGRVIVKGPLKAERFEVGGAISTDI